MNQSIIDSIKTESCLYLAELEKRVLIFDGAMGTQIQNHNLTAEDYGGKEGCNEYLVITRPDVISAIHDSYFAVGVDVVETDSFTASRLKLDEYGLGHLTEEVNMAAATLARQSAERYATPDQPRFVAGSIGPTGMLPSADDPVLSNITFDQLEEIFYEQARYLIAGGVDLLLIETSQDILEVKAAIFGLKRAREEVLATKYIPIQVQVSLDTSGRMLLGTDIGAVMTTLEGLAVDIIGLNCSTGPEHMREPVRFLGENARLPISIIPNAGLPLNEGGRAIYPLDPRQMATELREFVEEFGVSIVGGCCGTTPEHLAAVVAAIGHNHSQKEHAPKDEARLSSAIRSSTMKQEPPPLIVGERVNTQGSKKMKKYILNDDYDGVLRIAREQIESGAHVLDVCTALTERGDEAYTLSQVVKKLSMSVDAPLVLDSTEPDALIAALKYCPGRPIINSINMENGRQKIDTLVPVAKAHGAALVAMTIDERGMARTLEHKVEVAHKIYDIVVGEYGMAPEDLIYDTLTFPLSTGMIEERNSGRNAIEAIRQIKAELPGVMTILGVSNVSFGLSPQARVSLNAVFLYHAVAAGLDMAIVHPSHVRPYAEIPEEERKLCDDLIFNTSPDALSNLIAFYEANKGSVEREEKEDPTEGMTPDQKIHWKILHRKKENIEEQIDLSIDSSERLAISNNKSVRAVHVLNTVLLPAMKEVGDKFGAGELILPFVLQSAEAMKKAVAHLEQYLEKVEGYTKGKVVLATVFGDVHDIGKNLVNTILTNNGYTVYDLGKQVPLNTIIDKAIEVNATAIGLSALLVSTSKQMPLCVKELDKRGLNFPVLIGGAAINRAYGRRVLYVEEERPYAPGVFYCKDAFEGLSTMDKLSDPARHAQAIVELLQSAEDNEAKDATREAALNAARQNVTTKRSNIATDNPVPTPPFWGARRLENIDMAEVFRYLDLKSLYRLSWGGKGVHGAEWEKLLAEDFKPRLERMKTESLDPQTGFLDPAAVYGYYPCQSTGNELIVYDPDLWSQKAEKKEITRFSFPRQVGNEELCLADYFKPVESNIIDVIPLQVVTMGQRASEVVNSLQKSGDYSSSYFIHGLAVEAAEALAEYTHRHVKQELGVFINQGKRYSWGYPACPELEDHEKLFKILPITELIGVELTESYQLVPEQSTAAMVVHHPQAKYYSVRSRSFPDGGGEVADEQENELAGAVGGD